MLLCDVFTDGGRGSEESVHRGHPVRRPTVYAEKGKTCLRVQNNRMLKERRNPFATGQNWAEVEGRYEEVKVRKILSFDK